MYGFHTNLNSYHSGFHSDAMVSTVCAGRVGSNKYLGTRLRSATTRRANLGFLFRVKNLRFALRNQVKNQPTLRYQRNVTVRPGIRYSRCPQLTSRCPLLPPQWKMERRLVPPSPTQC